MKKGIRKQLFILKEEKGRTMTETLAAMLLLILLGAGCFGLAFSTVNAYHRLFNAKGQSAELRVASSFVMTKIRQNDLSGCLEIKPIPSTGKNALVIYENIEGTDYATWIFYEEGQLWEALITENELPSVELSQPVAQIDSFEINYDRNHGGIRTKVGIDGRLPYESFIKIKSN